MRAPAKRIPIRVAKSIAEEFGQAQVIVVTWDSVVGRTHVVTFGKTLKDGAQAAEGGNRVKRALGWPDELCDAVPARVRRAEGKPRRRTPTRR